MRAGAGARGVRDAAPPVPDDGGDGAGEEARAFGARAGEAGRRGCVWDSADFPPVDVRALPVPRYDLLAGRPYNRFTVQTSRGCPWRCDFCASNVMLRRGYRKRPVADVVRDVREVARLRGRPFIEFADDNTFVDKEWGKELCRELAPLKLKWFTETDVTVADDPELLRLLREARCRQVLIGLESPGRGPLEGVELRANFKARRSAGKSKARGWAPAHSSAARHKPARPAVKLTKRPRSLLPLTPHHAPQGHAGG